MKRIQPDDVIAAYRTKGLKAMTCSLDAMSNEACCALGAVLYASGQHPGREGSGYDNIAKILGLSSRDYVAGFVSGFDSGDRSNPITFGEDEMMLHFNSGLEDGKSARKAVFAEKLWVSPDEQLFENENKGKF